MKGAIEQLRYSNNGKFIVSSSSDGKVKVWDAKDLKLLNAFDKTDECTEAFALSMDSKRISIGKHDGKLLAFPLRASKESKPKEAKPRVGQKARTNKANTDYKEAEPNNHPLDAQMVSLPATIAGQIHNAKDDGKKTAGQK